MPYRAETKRPVDLEIDALHDMLVRIQRVRRQVALPVGLVTAVCAMAGMLAHGMGYWPILGAADDGSYLVAMPTLLVAGALCALPALVPGAALYFALRARTRRTWRIAHARAGLDEAWLDENVARYG